MILPWKNKKINEEFLGINERNLDYVYSLNPKRHFKLADDKILTKEVLKINGISCADTYAVISKIGEIPQILKVLEQQKLVAIKPAKGAGGGGILILKKSQDGDWFSGGVKFTNDQIFSHLARIIMGMYSFGTTDRVLIEQCIIPHEFFEKIYPCGVPDFRVIVSNDKPIMSMLRVPTDKSGGKANLHQGGLGIGINMDTGHLTHSFDGSRYFNFHPDNGNQIYGIKIPYWKDIINLSVQTSKCFPLDYLGIDIVIDEYLGPMIMEINVRPGLGIQLANKKGLRNPLIKIK